MPFSFSRKFVSAFTLLSLMLIILGTTTAFAQGIYKVDIKQVFAKTDPAVWQTRFTQAKQAMPDMQVQTLEDFVKITEYYNAFVADGKITHQFITRNDEQIYCIDIKSQGAIKAAGLDPKTMPLAPVLVPPLEKSQGPSISIYHSGLDGSLDQNGNQRKCPAGSFPKLIRPLKQYYRFKTFEDIFRKYPDDKNPRFFRSGEKYDVSHHYGVVANYYDNTGQQADFNLWEPYVVGMDNEFSLGQLWVARGEGNDLQTVELGWQKYPLLYGNSHSNLFIFYTPDNYSSGCYNLDCGGFVQTDTSVVIGGSFPNYSSMGGNQYDVTLGFIRDGSGGNHWWLRYGSKWVGYYPNSLFDQAGIAAKSDLVNFGGEIIDSYNGGQHTDTEMGSGQFPKKGYGYAAYIKKIQYVNLSGNLTSPTSLYEQATVPDCWGIGSVENSSDSDWLTNFFFGGSCDNYEPGDDDDDTTDDDDTDDDDSGDDDSADDDDQDDDDSDENSSEDCANIMEIVYNQCGYNFYDGDNAIGGEMAYNMCKDDVGNWDCIFECAADEKVDGCSTLAACFEQACDVKAEDDSEDSSDDDDDDNDDGACCG